MARGQQQPPPGLATAALPAAGRLRFTAEEQEQDAEETNIHIDMPQDYHVTIARDRDVRLNDNSFWYELRDKSREAEMEADKHSRRNVPRGHTRGGKRQPPLPAVRMAVTASIHQAGANDRLRHSTLRSCGQPSSKPWAPTLSRLRHSTK